MPQELTPPTDNLDHKSNLQKKSSGPEETYRLGRTQCWWRVEEKYGALSGVSRFYNHYISVLLQVNTVLKTQDLKLSRLYFMEQGEATINEIAVSNRILRTERNY